MIIYMGPPRQSYVQVSAVGSFILRLLYEQVGRPWDGGWDQRTPDASSIVSMARCNHTTVSILYQAYPGMIMESTVTARPGPLAWPRRKGVSLEITRYMHEQLYANIATLMKLAFRKE